jgi:hypothetical protein
MRHTVTTLICDLVSTIQSFVGGGHHRTHQSSLPHGTARFSSLPANVVSFMSSDPALVCAGCRRRVHDAHGGGGDGPLLHPPPPRDRRGITWAAPIRPGLCAPSVKSSAQSSLPPLYLLGFLSAAAQQSISAPPAPLDPARLEMAAPFPFRLCSLRVFAEHEYPEGAEAFPCSYPICSKQQVHPLHCRSAENGRTPPPPPRLPAASRRALYTAAPGGGPRIRAGPGGRTTEEPRAAPGSGVALVGSSGPGRAGHRALGPPRSLPLRWIRAGPGRAAPDSGVAALVGSHGRGRARH